MNKITITVEGPAGSGKTAVSQYLKDVLFTRGFEVSYTDPDANEYTRSENLKNQCLNNSLRRCEVTIVEKQAPRSRSYV